MADNDMLMLRGETPGVYNLAVGEPYFLHGMYFTSPRFLPPADPSYPPFKGDPILIEALKRYHGGAYKHIVVTVGAKQALLAAMYAYRNRTDLRRYIVHQPPFWPSYPTLTRLSGMNFVHAETGTGLDVKISTSPNNPDGAQSEEPCHIWDAAYAHSVYGHNVAPAHEVSVWSAAKLFGLSGLRIGWLATNDDELARLAAEYVEITTSGVSMDCQKRLHSVVDYVNTNDVSSTYAKRRQDLLANGQDLVNQLGGHLEEIQGVPTTGTGMFAWFKPKDYDIFVQALDNAQVKMIPGDACGQPGWIRMNCGHKPSYTEQALEKLAKEIKRLER